MVAAVTWKTLAVRSSDQVAEIQRIAGDWVTYLQQATSYASTEANSAVTALQANLTAQTTAADAQLTETTAADTAFAGAEANAASALIDGEAVAAFNQVTTSANADTTETASIAAANKADEYATATAAQEQIANDAAAQATQQINDANAEATRVKDGWNAYATYAAVQANADATQTELIDTASSTFKMALATADTTWATAIGNAQITAKGAQAQAQYDYALAIAYSSPIQLLSAANDKLSADQNALPSTFANVQPQPLQKTVYQLAADAYKNDGFLGLFSYTADVASNGGWSRTLLSPQFTRALNAADGIFAGWADVLTFGVSTKLRTGMWGDLATRNHSGQYFELGQTIGQIHLMAFEMAINPCALGAAARWAYRGLDAIQAVYNLGSVYSDLEQGHYFAAGLDALSVFGSVFNMFRACFVAGTPLLTPEGSKPIEQFEVGDKLLSRDEFTPAGEVRARRVLAKFETISPILNLHVGGRIIGTTSEHPFWVEGLGWIAAKDLRTGDVLVSHDGQWRIVEGVADSGRVEAVYNLAVEDDHTYFVGGVEWGFSVWVHNKCTDIVSENGQTILKIENKFAAGSAESRQLQRFVRAWNEEIANAGGSMTRRVLTAEEQAASAAWTEAMREQFPARFGLAGKVVGHVPDAAAGGLAVPDRAMALLPSVNSYLGGLLGGVPVGTTYNVVRLFR